MNFKYAFLGVMLIAGLMAFPGTTVVAQEKPTISAEDIKKLETELKAQKALVGKALNRFNASKAAAAKAEGALGAERGKLEAVEDQLGAAKAGLSVEGYRKKVAADRKRKATEEAKRRAMERQKRVAELRKKRAEAQRKAADARKKRWAEHRKKLLEARKKAAGVHSIAGKWVKVAGKALDIGVSSGRRPGVYVVGTNGAPYRFNAGKWARMPGGLARLTVGPRGFAWGVNKGNAIYRHDGKKWSRLSGKATDIAVSGEGEAYVVGMDKAIWRLIGKKWNRIGGTQIIRVAASDEDVYALDSRGRVFYLRPTENRSIRWDAQKLPFANDIGATKTATWIAGKDGHTYVLARGGVGKTTKRIVLPGGATNIDAGPTGVWAINRKNEIFQLRKQ